MNQPRQIGEQQRNQIGQIWNTAREIDASNQVYREQLTSVITAAAKILAWYESEEKQGELF